MPPITRSRFFGAGTVLGAIVALATAAHAVNPRNPLERCQKGRFTAAGKYAACQQKAAAILYGGGSLGYQAAAAKCTVKYGAVWARLQAQASGSLAPCEAPRFVDNGQTVTDNLTGLEWEKKTVDATIHDQNNRYSWSAAGSEQTAADGPVFTTFLAALNGGACFAGQCDWRLPTVEELQTILFEPYQCGANPCIDPIFGSAALSYYWTATPDPINLYYMRVVSFGNGFVSAVDKGSTESVRAVRAKR